MSEIGGPTTQSGIYYQNSVAALFLGRLLDPRSGLTRKRVIEVRVEAPTFVDDVVVQHADGSSSFIQAKESLDTSSGVWEKLWSDFCEQKKRVISENCRLVIVVGNVVAETDRLRELCERAKGKKNSEEWLDSLSSALKALATKIVDILPEQTPEAAFRLLEFVEVWIWPLDSIERDLIRDWIPQSNISPNTLLDLLRGKIGGRARNRGTFKTAELLDTLAIDDGVTIYDAPGWGADAYRVALKTHLGTLTVPGTNLSGPIDKLFLWLPLRDRTKDGSKSDFEDEDPRWRWTRTTDAIDLQEFPRGATTRAVINAGAGFGKTTLLHAIACKLCSGTRIPALIPLDSLSAENSTVINYLADVVNTEYNVHIDWERICESGRAVVLFDGLDELSTNDRTRVLEAIGKFAARFPQTSYLLTVRDNAALSIPLGVPVLTLDRLDDSMIGQFAKSYATSGGRLSPEVLFGQIRRHPDLAHLLRIPLFLALVLASVGPEDDLPHSRSDLLEHYLGLLFSPEKRKSMARPTAAISDLRDAAECLAWRGLEADRIGISERETLRLLQNSGFAEQSATYVDQLIRIGVLRRVAVRLHFSYPILQEYLAACWMVSRAPSDVAPRFSQVAYRPWAQALQFALEMHPESEKIIQNQLEVPDDAFNTSLRLIARCIVNGAKVSPTLRLAVGDRLAEAWPSESFLVSSSIGYLLADGFADPLSERAKNHLVAGWALSHGGAELVVAKSCVRLTTDVLRGVLSRDLTLRPYLHGWQPAVDEIADLALDLYLERVRKGKTSTEEVESLSSLISELPPLRLKKERWREIATDETLPLVIRLAGYRLGPKVVPDSAWALINDLLSTNVTEGTHSGFYKVFQLFWRMTDSEAKFNQMLTDETISQDLIHEAIAGLWRSELELDARLALLQRVRISSKLNRERFFLVLSCAAILGDREAEEETVQFLADQEPEYVQAWLLHANRFSKRTVDRAAEVLSTREFSSEDLFKLMGNADFGLSYRTEMYSFNSAAGSEPYLHPSRGEMLNRLSSCFKGTAESIRSLVILYRSGQLEVRGKLIVKLNESLLATEGFMSYENDSEINSALYCLNSEEALPVDLLFHVVEKSNSNAGREAIGQIVRQANEEHMKELLRRYNHRDEDFVKGGMFSALETLSGRFNRRIVRDGEKLRIDN